MVTVQLMHYGIVTATHAHTELLLLSLREAKYMYVSSVSFSLYIYVIYVYMFLYVYVYTHKFCQTFILFIWNHWHVRNFRKLWYLQLIQLLYFYYGLVIYIWPHQVVLQDYTHCWEYLGSNLSLLHAKHIFNPLSCLSGPNSVYFNIVSVISRFYLWN